MTPDAADGNTQQGQAAPVPQDMSRPRRSPVKRVRRGEETQGSGRGISACGSSERSGLCVDEGAGREPDFDHQSERRGEGAAHQVTELPKWVHPRLRGYDYSRSGVYFLTLCTQNRLPILSEIVGRGIPDAPLIQLSETGRCVQDAMDYLAGHDAQIQIAASVIMPNHVHILLCVCGEGNAAPYWDARAGFCLLSQALHQPRVRPSALAGILSRPHHPG